MAFDPAEARRGPSEPRPTQRRIIAPSRQRLMLRVTWRTVPIRFSLSLMSGTITVRRPRVRGLEARFES